MTLTVRLDPDLEKRFTAAVRRQKRTKSEVVTQLLTRYVEAREPKSAYELAVEMGIVGSVGDTPPDLATNSRKYLQAALRAKAKREAGRR